MPVPELEKFRQKYPEYGDMDDSTLAQKLATKYPEYGDLPARVAAEMGPTHQSPLDHPAAKAGFQGLGMMTGGLLTLPTAPATLGAGPIAGSIGGAIAAESLRQSLAGMTGGGPKTYGQMGQGLQTAAMDAAIGEAIPPAIGAAAKPIGQAMGVAGRAVYRNIPDPILDWVKQRYSQGVDVLNMSGEDAKQAILMGAGKLGQAVKKVRMQPETVAPPTPKALYVTAEKAANAFDAVREAISGKYGEAAVAAQEKPLRVSLTDALKSLFTELKQRGIVDPKGTAIQLGDRGFTGEERLLLNSYNDLLTLRPTGQNLTEGLPGEAKYQVARRMLDRFDEAIGAASTRNTKRILIQARETIAKGIAAADAGLASVSPEYGQFVALRETMETAFKDPDKTVRLMLNSMKETSQGLNQKLKALSDLAPENMRFYDDLVDYQTKTANADLAKKAPQTISKFIKSMQSPQDYERVVVNIFRQPETTMKELQALEAATGMKFLDELRDIAARKMFRGMRPAGLGLPINPVTAMLGLGGFGTGGPLASAAGIGMGTAMSIPRVQAEMLRRSLPAQQAITQAGRALRPAVPGIPPQIAALLRLGEPESPR